MNKQFKSVEMYGFDTCPYCIKAKKLLKHYNIDYTYYDVTKDDYKNKMMKRTNGATSVPQIFINNQHIGGYDNLTKLIKLYLKKRHIK